MRRLCNCAVLACFVTAGPAYAEGDRILFHAGYGTPDGVVVEGRIVGEVSGEVPPSADDGKLRNLRRNVRAFVNDERKHTPLAVRLGGQAWETTSDAEGYFRIDGAAGLAPGWHAVDGAAGHGAGAGRVLVVSPRNTLGLISDLDDTLVVSEVPDKRRLLANTFFKNPAQREAVPGVAALYAGVAAANADPDAAPLFYLSASPRQLHGAIADFLGRNGFPPGVLITKRVTDDRSSDPLTDQFAYKTGKIEEILSRVPAVRFILVGDDGERDPEIYEDVRRRHPERIAAIWIRRVHPDPARPRLAGQTDLAEVLAAGAAAQPPLVQPPPSAL